MDTLTVADLDLTVSSGYSEWANMQKYFTLV